MFNQTNKNEYTGDLILFNQKIRCLNVGKKRYVGIEIFNLFNANFLDYLEDDLNKRLNNTEKYFYKYYYNAFDVVDVLADIAFNKNKYPNEIFILGEALFNSLKNIGLIPLIDEVTGYQNFRCSTELRDLFAKIMK